MLQAVFFDMGGTIETYRHDRELRLQATPDLNKILLQAGIDLGLGIEQLCTVVTEGLARYRLWSSVSLTELSPARAWGEYILGGCPVDARRLASVAEDLSCFLETRYYHREMRPGIPQVLETIQEMGLKMGVISNTLSRGQVPGKLEEYGIKHFFAPIVMSSIYGRRKPDPAIFHHAASLAGVPTGACAHVGDRIVRDIMGARRAGYRLAIQIRHDTSDGERDDGPSPDAVLDNMMELVDVLEAELHRSSSTDMAGDKRGSVRAILFDAGDLLYYRPNKGERIDAFLAEVGVSRPKNFRVVEQALKTRAFQGEIDLDQYREALLRICGIQEQAHIERGKHILHEQSNDVRFFDGVRDTLIALKERGFLLGIVTDTAHPTHVKLRWFEGGGIGHLWDAFVSSRDQGVRKPDPRIYHAALQQLGVQPCQAIFVGHKASELNGAKAVGMQTVAFNRDDDAEGDTSIEHFAELLDLPAFENSTRGE